MPSGLAIASGIAQGLEKATQNIYNIGIAKQELKQREELFTIQKKKALLDIDEMEYTHTPDQRAAAKELTTAKINMALSEINLHKTQITTAETKAQKELEMYQKGQLMVENFLAGKIRLPKGATVKMGNFGISAEKGGKVSTSLLDLMPQGSEGAAGAAAPATVDDFLSQF
jgi:hypothetical protein